MVIPHKKKLNVLNCMINPYATFFIYSVKNKLHLTKSAIHLENYHNERFLNSSNKLSIINTFNTCVGLFPMEFSRHIVI